MTENTKNQTGQRIKYYMELRNITQQELAEELGINRSSVSNWISGKQMPRVEKIDAMAKYFGCKVTDLVSVPTAVKAETEHDTKRKILYDLSLKASDRDLDIVTNLLREMTKE